jgi:trans-2,3-dihydro-3-hydroxyanthranilate isomerase
MLFNMASTRIPFHFVDVFAVEPLTGNPLAVVDGGAELSDEVMKRIAREFNQSETTFVLPPTRPKADWLLRSFTAAGIEVFGGGGHNSLGAWWWLAEAGRLALPDAENTFHQEILGDHILPVAITQVGGRPANVVMDQQMPVAGRQPGELTALAAALGLAVTDLAVDRVPCQVVSTGAAHLMVPVRDRAAVDRSQPDAKALYAILHEVGAEGCYLFSLDPPQPGATAYARFFNPTVGIAEDPATGTAAGPLAAHLVAHRLATRDTAVMIEQGTRLGRTSLIRVEVLAHTVRVSGRGVIVASGHLQL